MKVAGIDPGTLHTGIGIVEPAANGGYVLIHAETIHAPAKKPVAERLHGIYLKLKEILMIYRPEVVAIETVFYSKDFRAAVKIGEARAMAALVAKELSIALEEYPPARVKQAVCGNGRAHKSQIQFMIKQMLRLKELPPPDSADALAIALCYFQANHINMIRKASAAAKLV